MPRADLAQAQGIVERQRMRNAGLVELRCHDPDVVRQRARNLLDDLQAGRMDTVIIGAENSHSPGDLFERFRGKYHGVVLSVDHGSGKPRKDALKSRVLPINDYRLPAFASLGKPSG